ncbi:unnamed protein product, partial [Coregonus sp. 'balchen']
MGSVKIWALKYSVVKVVVFLIKSITIFEFINRTNAAMSAVLTDGAVGPLNTETSLVYNSHHQHTHLHSTSKSTTSDSLTWITDLHNEWVFTYTTMTRALCGIGNTM